LSDLLGVSETGCAKLPTEGAVGFDTIGTYLQTSPLHLELFDGITDDALARFFALPPDAPSRRKIVICDPSSGTACVGQVLRTFGRAAWRRPLQEAEVASLVALTERARSMGEDATGALRASMQAVLLSPHFAFKLELDDGAKLPRALTAHELATRLSYALWSSMPDDELSRAADSGKLTDPATLEAQIVRMLDSPRARALTTDFAGQWLAIRDLPAHETDAQAYPKLVPGLKQAMADQLAATFDHYLRGDRPYVEMASADYAVGVSDALASYLGLPAAGPNGQRSLAGTPRRGLVGAAGVQVVTARGAKTSYVARGVFVLDRLLCRRPPDPPPGVPKLPDVAGAMTKRQIADAHSGRPECAACHSWIDPIGLGMEVFDAAGRARTVDELGNPVETAGALPGETGDAAKRPFDGPVQLASLLGSGDGFRRCVADRFLTFAIGRRLDDDDGQEWTKRIADDAARRGGRLRALLFASLSSSAFRARGGSR
jgi:hypothetical protein